MTIDYTKRYTDSDGRQWWPRLDQGEQMTHYWCPERGVRSNGCSGVLTAKAKAEGCVALELCPEYNERTETMWGWAEATGWQRCTRDLAEDDCHASLWPDIKRWLPVEATAQVLARRYGDALKGAKVRDPEGGEGVVSSANDGMVTMDYGESVGVWWKGEHLIILAPPEQPAQSEAPQEPSEPEAQAEKCQEEEQKCEECGVPVSAGPEPFCGYCDHRLRGGLPVETSELRAAVAMSAAAEAEERQGPVLRHVRTPAKAPVAEQWGAEFENKEWR